jgi:hypothetical protein
MVNLGKAYVYIHMAKDKKKRRVRRTPAVNPLPAVVLGRVIAAALVV